MTEASQPFDVTPEQERALSIARTMIKAGIPIFAAPPCPDNCATPGHGGTEYHLPHAWEKTYPSDVWLERWRPGWGLAAVGGSAADFLDEDAHHGGDAAVCELQAAGQWPRVYGVASTPSGGRHHIISPLGEPRAAGVMPGLDYQGGMPDGAGRAFIWIAPTVKRSKHPDTLDEVRPYVWEQVPDLALLAEFAGSDDSGEGIVARLHAKRAPRERVERTDVIAGDPFITEAEIARHGRDFTLEQANTFCAPVLANLRGACLGEIEERMNAAAVTLAHFVPEFWTAGQAHAVLLDNARHITIDGQGWRADHPSAGWSPSKFLPVLDGTRTIGDAWVAGRREAVADGGASPVTVEEQQSLMQKLIAEMRSPTQIANRPPPKYLIEDVLNLDSEAWVIGKPGSKKSFVVLDMVGHIARGLPWQGHRVRKARCVVIVAEGASGLSLRVRAWEKTYGPMGDDVFFLPRPVQAGDPAAWRVLVDACAELRPGMVVIDTQARSTVGLEENSATDMGRYIEAVRAVRERTEACVLTVHHSGRAGVDARGSSAIDGAQGTELRVEVEGRKAELRGSLVMDKQKDMAEGDESGQPLTFQVVDIGVDPESGRQLTSLALAETDPFRPGRGEGGLPRAYVPAFEQRDTWRRALLDVLYVYAPVGHGMTKAEAFARLESEYPDRFTTTKPARNGGVGAAWKDLLELCDPGTADRVIGGPSASRFEVVSLAVRAGLGAALDT